MKTELAGKIDRLKTKLKISEAMLNVLSKEAEDYMMFTKDLNNLMHARGFLTEVQASEYKNYLKCLENKGEIGSSSHDIPQQDVDL